MTMDEVELLDNLRHHRAMVNLYRRLAKRSLAKGEECIKAIRADRAEQAAFDEQLRAIREHRYAISAE